MGRVTLKNLLAKKFRLVLTSVAVMLGVAFMAGTFVLTDTMGKVFDDLFADVYQGVDIGVRAEEPFAAGGGPGAQVPREPLDASARDLIEGVPGVAAVQGGVRLMGVQIVKLVGGKPEETVKHGQAPGIGLSWGPNRELSRSFRDVIGHRPNRPDQVALDQTTAEDAGITEAEVRRCASGDCSGARVEVTFTVHPPDTFDVVAIFKSNAGGATLAVFDTATAQELFDRVGKFDEIWVAKDSGVSTTALRGEIRTALRDDGVRGVEVLSGSQLAQDRSDEIRDNLSFFNIFLLIFAVIALFVGAFIIYNTFSIIVAQRTRELGLMRALGASGRQVRRSVGIEAFVVGLLSSVLGLGLGIGVALGLQAAFRALGIDLPADDTVIATRTVVVSIIVGTAITFLSAISPARRAATVPPMAALREHTTAPSSGRRRYLIGSVLTIVGVVALGAGLFVDVEGFPGGAAGLVGIAAAMVFVGVAMLSPLLVAPLTRGLGWFAARLRGMTGVLARENAVRNPRRTASTAAALMVGLALVTVVAVLGASLKSTVKGVLEDDYKAELSLTTAGFVTPISPQAAEAVRDELPGSEVTEFRFGLAEIAGETKGILGVDTNLESTVDVHPRPGAMERFRDGGLLIYKDAYDDLTATERQRGSIDIRFGTTGKQRVPIAGVFDEKDAVTNNYLLPMPLYVENVTDQLDLFVSVKLPPGMSIPEAKRRIERVLEPFPAVEAKDAAEFQQQQEAQIDQFLNLMYVLLALAVLIALLGIVNALALSVFERTREIGLLRAVGMTRVQLRRMIRYESVMISVFGSLLGLALGLVFGSAMIKALENEGIAYAFPAGQVVTFLVLAGIAGVIAAWFPARRAARLDVLRAVQSE